VYISVSLHHHAQMILYTVGQKTAPFYVCNKFVKVLYSKIIIGTYVNRLSTSFEVYHYSDLQNAPCVRVFIINLTLA